MVISAIAVRSDNMKLHPIVRDIKEVLLSTGFEESIIIDVSISDDLIQLTLLLPYHADSDELEDILLNLKEELKATDTKIISRSGKKITIQFGKRNLDNVIYHKDLLHMNTLKIELPSAFGSCILDFEDGASCHLLNGGTTRMGKTSFLLYMCAVLYLQTKGEIDLYITSTKAKDYYPFNGIARISKTEDDFNNILDELIHEYKSRDYLLYSKVLEKATDAKSVKSLYPNYYSHFQPIFLIIDEYARFSDNKEIQKKIQELVESAGYVNIHIIISTQRPDARTVLPPRIKSNLLARICFTTADKNNSIVILDQEGAEKLGKIEGRAIFLDSETNIIQVPYITPTECEELLKPYKKENTNGNQTKQETTGSINHDVSSKIQNLFKESIGEISLPQQQQPSKRSQQSNEKVSNGWFLLESNKREG
jgi:DNA segregation ATPase FtsK/SpoIIIE, S-DNA-T family